MARVKLDNIDKQDLADFCDFFGEKWDEYKEAVEETDFGEIWRDYNYRFKHSIGNANWMLAPVLKSTLFEKERDYMTTRRIINLAEMYKDKYDDRLMDLYEVAEEGTGLLEGNWFLPEKMLKNFNKFIDRVHKERKNVKKKYGVDLGIDDFRDLRRKINREAKKSGLSKSDDAERGDEMYEITVEEAKYNVLPKIGDDLLPEIEVPLDEIGSDLYAKDKPAYKSSETAPLHRDWLQVNVNYQRAEIVEPFVADQRTICKTWEKKGFLTN